jgi:hypothetical protein
MVADADITQQVNLFKHRVDYDTLDYENLLKGADTNVGSTENRHSSILFFIQIGNSIPKIHKSEGRIINND